MAKASNARKGSCEQCGEEFGGNQPRKRFCSERCRKRAEDARPISTVYRCEGCEAEFRPKRTDRTRYCSRDCSFAHGAAHKRAILTRMERYPPAPKPDTSEVDAIRRMGRSMPASLGRLRVMAGRRLRSRKPCLACSSPIGVGRAGSGGADYCSSRCAKLSPAYREAKRAARLARKIRQRAARVETVLPLKVFERDGWRCHLCGGLTIKAKRGSYHNKAPELDHIVPLSKGGDHSYRNTACAHRVCNIAKSDRVVGQPSLLSAL